MKQQIALLSLFRAGVFASTLLICGTAFSHAQLLMEGATPPRYNTASLKNTAPCGNEGNFSNLKTNRVSIFISGETINVEWKETVNHSGLFYVDFSTTGINGPYMLESTVPDVGTATEWNMSYTLPDAICTDCVLRMRQDMGNVDISGHYFSCADVILVSGDDVVAPSSTTNITTMVNGNDIDVSWSNPGDPDCKSTIVVRSQANLSSSPQARKDYLVSDQIGNGVVVYKGTASQFTDAGLQEMTSYTYTIYSYDNDYNYDTGAVSTATTDQQSTGGGEPMTGPGNDGGSGALSLWWLLATLALRRRR